MTTMSSTTPIWFITGASSGLGRALAEAVLARGWRAAVTARRPDTLGDLTAAHGKRALALEPGGFRTDWAGRSMAESSTIIEDYAETAGKRRQATRSVSGRQPGDPARAATAIISAFEAGEPPLRLLLGAASLKIARERLDALRATFDAWAETTLSADFPN
ncbi:hypothetical protein [Rhizobium bangladeshense]|uniref:hypothetical protein n=1 Tax=Rhizobium bangladeshense TaxID=1138189 RepID=UPI001C82B658|nr:hypothetical protein [Rhizobium bangladeshense]